MSFKYGIPMLEMRQSQKRQTQKSIISESGEFEIVMFQASGYFDKDIIDQNFNRDWNN